MMLGMRSVRLQHRGSRCRMASSSAVSRFSISPLPTYQSSAFASRSSISATSTYSPLHAAPITTASSFRFISTSNSAQKHFRANENAKSEESARNKDDYVLPHPIWSEEEVKKVEYTHVEPPGMVDQVAYAAVRTVRFGFDVMSGYYFGKMNEAKYIRRIVFLETVAGVPGFVGGMIRHLNSLRKMKRDHGWIHTLLEEAENERMHLMFALELRQPSLPFRLMVLMAQGIFVNSFFFAYLVSPHFCHRFVGYLEEEAVVTYTKILEDIDNGTCASWATMAAPPVAKNYWKLADDATVRDVMLAIRADESHHRDVNHTFADMKADDQNPFDPGH